MTDIDGFPRGTEYLTTAELLRNISEDEIDDRECLGDRYVHPNIESVRTGKYHAHRIIWEVSETRRRNIRLGSSTNSSLYMYIHENSSWPVLDFECIDGKTCEVTFLPTIVLLTDRSTLQERRVFGFNGCLHTKRQEKARAEQWRLEGERRYETIQDAQARLDAGVHALRRDGLPLLGERQAGADSIPSPMVTDRSSMMSSGLVQPAADSRTVGNLSSQHSKWERAHGIFREMGTPAVVPQLTVSAREPCEPFHSASQHKEQSSNANTQEAQPSQFEAEAVDEQMRRDESVSTSVIQHETESLNSEPVGSSNDVLVRSSNEDNDQEVEKEHRAVQAAQPQTEVQEVNTQTEHDATASRSSDDEDHHGSDYESSRPVPEELTLTPSRLPQHLRARIRIEFAQDATPSKPKGWRAKISGISKRVKNHVKTAVALKHRNKILLPRRRIPCIGNPAAEESSVSSESESEAADEDDFDPAGGRADEGIAKLLSVLELQDPRQTDPSSAGAIGSDSQAVLIRSRVDPIPADFFTPSRDTRSLSPEQSEIIGRPIPRETIPVPQFRNYAEDFQRDLQLSSLMDAIIEGPTRNEREVSKITRGHGVKHLATEARDRLGRQRHRVWPGRRKEGVLYIFSRPDCAGKVKIGQTCKTLHKRLDEWRQRCKLREIEKVRSWEKVRYPQFIERLVFLDLAEFRRRMIVCRGPTTKGDLPAKAWCKKEHREWFECEARTAIASAERWIAWQNTGPYNAADAVSSLRRPLKLRATWADHTLRLQRLEIVWPSFDRAEADRRIEAWLVGGKEISSARQLPALESLRTALDPLTDEEESEWEAEEEIVGQPSSPVYPETAPVQTVSAGLIEPIIGAPQPSQKTRVPEEIPAAMKIPIWADQGVPDLVPTPTVAALSPILTARAATPSVVTPEVSRLFDAHAIGSEIAKLASTLEQPGLSRREDSSDLESSKRRPIFGFRQERSQMQSPLSVRVQQQQPSRSQSLFGSGLKSGDQQPQRGTGIQSASATPLVSLDDPFVAAQMTGRGDQSVRSIEQHGRLTKARELPVPRMDSFEKAAVDTPHQSSSPASIEPPEALGANRDSATSGSVREPAGRDATAERDLLLSFIAKRYQVPESVVQRIVAARLVSLASSFVNRMPLCNQNANIQYLGSTQQEREKVTASEEEEIGKLDVS